jgi:hypothetical protein
MARIPFDPNTSRAAANFAHSPCGMTPRNYDVPEARPNPPPNTSGWSDRPMVNPNSPQHPVPGIAQCDRLVAAAERAEREQASAPDNMLMKLAAAVTAMMQMQTQTLAMLAHLTNKEAAEEKPKTGGNK